jgi:hypothetical protein
VVLEANCCQWIASLAKVLRPKVSQERPVPRSGRYSVVDR